MCDLFDIIEVPEDSILETEQLGTKDKFWYCEDELNYLYKKARPNTGEAWSFQLSVISYQYLCLFAQHSAGKSEA